VLAGANGVGKTTFARANLRAFIDEDAFLNADDIAREVNWSDVQAVAVEAGRRLLRQRLRILEQRQSFSIETTLASRTLLKFVSRVKIEGYSVKLVFLFTPFPSINELRVKQRVMSGGHNVDTDTIRRRHKLGLRYLMQYWEACTEGLIFDARTSMVREIMRKDANGTHIVDPAGWSLLRDRMAAASAR
jgi:predicted ABC-type ATPase